MYKIEGKVLVFSDLHVGLKGGMTSRLKIAATCIKEIIAAIKKEKIGTVIFCGDYFHSRKSIELNTLDIGYKLLNVLSKYAKVYLITGNHDLFYKNVNDIASINIFKDNANIVVVSGIEEVEINSQIGLFVPWNSVLEELPKSKYDLMFGHFDISSKYVIASYIEANIKKSKTAKSALIEDMLKSDSLLTEASEDSLESEVSSIIRENLKSNDLVGSFVELVKKGGQVYAGHIHQHKEFISNGREFIFVGSPYQQNFGEIDSDCGFYILDEANKRKFILINSVPKHIKISNVEVEEVGVDKFDFSIVKNNIVQRIIDKEIPRELDIKIAQGIISNSPFEEALAEYSIKINSIIDESQSVTDENLELMKKSKLEYIKKYIDELDSKILKENELDPNKLYKILEHYYLKVEENKQ